MKRTASGQSFFCNRRCQAGIKWTYSAWPGWQCVGQKNGNTSEILCEILSKSVDLFRCAG